MASKKANQKKLADLEFKIKLLQEYTQKWANFFNFFADGFANTKITGEMESQFFNITTALARAQYRLRFFLGSYCPGDDKFLSILSDAVSLSAISEMSEAQFGRLQHSWHVVFIALNKSLGHFIQEKEELVGPAAGQPNEKKAA